MANMAENAAKQLLGFLIGGLKDPDGRVRVEDLVSAAAALTGERCLEAAGDFPARDHDFPPGSRIFSDRVNQLLCDDRSLAESPPDSVFGTIRDRLAGSGYEPTDFPDLETVFAAFAAGVGDPADWGWVPLTVPPDNRPYLMPLRAAYETRPGADQIFGAFVTDPAQCLRAASLGLAEVLLAVREAIDHRIVLLLAFETINGMAKTAPMTDAAFRGAAASADARSKAGMDDDMQ